jgi:pimeloyl-ACP methyl ester carboxylesterase
VSRTSVTVGSEGAGIRVSERTGPGLGMRRVVQPTECPGLAKLVDPPAHAGCAEAEHGRAGKDVPVVQEGDAQADRGGAGADGGRPAQAVAAAQDRRAEAHGGRTERDGGRALQGPCECACLTLRGMVLHVRSWGAGGRVVVLLHGRLADGDAFWEVGPALAVRGYRAVAVDLPGHGKSPSDANATLDSAVEALRRTVAEAPELAIGHSLGGVVLAVAASDAGWRPARAVYVDSPVFWPVQDLALVTAQLVEEHKQRTPEWLRRERSWWRPGYVEAEIAANQAVDPPTAASLTVSAGGRDLMPPAGVPALAVRAGAETDPPRDDVIRLKEAGVEVRHVPGAGHSIWYGHFPEFMTAIDGWI